MTNTQHFPEEFGMSRESSLEQDAARLDACVARLGEARDMIASIILGQDDAVDQTLIGILAGGHVLMVGAPGLGKSLMAHTLGKALGLLDKRVQFTPDLMPADILGSEVLEEGAEGKRSFRFIKGPVFCQLLLADEINRASPRTQSALLQAMQEREVSVAGYSHALPQPFHVLATQNPLEQEGTYPLPEAQLDRFLLEVRLAYPDRNAERQIVAQTTGRHVTRPRQILHTDELIEAQDFVRRLPMPERVLDTIIALCRACRPESSSFDAIKNNVAWGPGTRAAQSLSLACRARAMLQGRFAPSLDDVAALAIPVLRHRFGLTYGARADGHSAASLIRDILSKIRDQHA
ncbi:ATPase AAA [Thalassospira profundimaris]|uniref:ATPase AAA n=1 Tax=Thalassospira profundimaris TaxID=502049 RepID=A0A367XEU8_9PROT|nr:MoxR family ATPase [Thalassospira profundimaris]RCK52196.1 ATPase AAA [Thalassospira profundimaris]